MSRKLDQPRSVCFHHPLTDCGWPHQRELRLALAFTRGRGVGGLIRPPLGERTTSSTIAVAQAAALAWRWRSESGCCLGRAKKFQRLLFLGPGKPTDAICLLLSHLVFFSSLHVLSLFIGWLRSHSQWPPPLPTTTPCAFEMKLKSKADSQGRIESGRSARHSIPQPPHRCTLLISMAKR